MRSRLVIPAAILVAVAYAKGRQDAQFFGPAVRPATPAPPVPGPTHASILRAEAEAADAWEVGLDERPEPEIASAEVAAALAEAPVARAEFVVDDDEPILDEPFIDDPGAEELRAAPAPLWIPDFDAVLVPEEAPSVFTPRGPAWEPDPTALSEWLGTPAGDAPRVETSGRFALGGWAVQAGHLALCGVTFPSRIAEEVLAGRIRLVPDALENVAADGLVVLDDAGFAPDGDGFTVLVAATAPGAFAASGRYELIAGSAG